MPYKDPAKKREMDRLYGRRYRATAKGREAVQRGQRAYYHRHKDELAERRKGDRERAYGLVHYHLKVGNIVAQPCQSCGLEAAQAHHPRGYVGAAALDIEWLCSIHHRAAHAA